MDQGMHSCRPSCAGADVASPVSEVFEHLRGSHAWTRVGASGIKPVANLLDVPGFGHNPRQGVRRITTRHVGTRHQRRFLAIHCFPRRQAMISGSKNKGTLSINPSPNARIIRFMMLMAGG